MIKLLAAGLAMSGTLALAADKLSAAGVPVKMVVTVEARHGKTVPVVYREDLMVHQGHDRLEVADWVALQGEHAGRELFLMLDDSSSSRLASYLDELRQFINSQPAAAVIAVGYMRNGTVDIVQNFTADHSRAAKALRLPFGSPGTVASPYLALSDLIKRWPANQAPHEILMVTNGIDGLGGIGPGNPYVDTAIDNAQRAGTIVYAIYTPGAGHYGHSSWRIFWGQNWLAKTAEETGGEAYFLGFEPPVSFAPYLTDLSERLMHQYLVTFLAKPDAKKPGLQPVKLSTEVPNAELVSASKVYVPAGQ